MNEHSLTPERRAAHVSQYIQDGSNWGAILVGKAYPDCKAADGAAEHFGTDRDPSFQHLFFGHVSA